MSQYTTALLFLDTTANNYTGPVFGPILGGYIATAKYWRWTIWTFTFLCTLVLLLLFFLLPETSSSNILYHRAKRLRKTTGNTNLRSQSEIVRRSALSDRFDEQIGDIKSQPLLCANIAIGRPLLLVLPSGMFTSRNRFSLPAVTELVVPV